MKKEPLQILMIEDNPGDARLIREYLHETDLDPIELDSVERLKIGLEHLTSGKPDIILLDLGLPDSRGLDTFRHVYAQSPEVPIIVLTGLDDLNQAVEAVKAGAQDYLAKGEVSGGLLVRAIHYAIERKRAEDALRESEQRLRRFYDSSLVGVVYWNMQGQITDANDKFLEMVGYTREELVAGQIDWVNMTPPEYRYLDDASVAELKSTGINKMPFEKVYIRKDGTWMPIILAGAMLDEARFNGVAFVLDITQRKRAEDGIIAAEKMARESLMTANQSRHALLSMVEDQKRTEENLAAAEAELRSLFAAMTDVVIVYDADGRYLKIAPTKLTSFYRPLDDMLGKTVYDILPKEQADYILARLRESIQGGETVNGEYALQMDGRETWFSASASRLSESTAVWVAHDITARKQAEDEVIQQSQQLRLLYEASQRLNQTLDRDEIHQALCEFMSANTPNDGFVISAFDPETQLITCRAFWMDNKWLDVSSFPSIPLEAEGKGTQSIAIRSGQSLLIRDFQAQLKTAQTSYSVNAETNEIESEVPAEEEDITRSALIVPLKIGGRVIGVIQVMSYRLDAFNESQLKLLEALALHISSAEQNAMLFAQVQAELNERRQAEEKIKSQLDELQRWQDVMLGREDRVQALKREINELCRRAGETARYPSQEDG